MTAGQENYLDVAFDKGLQLTFPPVLVQLLQALLKPSPSFRAISGYLQMDPMLASKILHIANSSSYGFNSRITDLERAAIAIGTDELLKLVIALSLQKRLAPKRKREAQCEFGDWRMTLWSAIAAEAIASRVCPLQKQEAYLAGMLKDLPLYLELCRDEVPSFLARSGLVTLPWPGQLAEELSHWGYSHPELTRDIFLYWGLPIELADAVRQHHDFTGKASYPRLTQSVIYATRWSELLHAPGADPAQAVAFELAMSAELGLDMESAATFRSSCAEKFNLLLSQLGIQQDQRTAAHLHDQPMQAIQRSYFLALGAVSECAPLSPQSLAATVQRYLRLFWNRTTFELFLNLGDADRGSLFRSASGSDLTEESASMTGVPARSDWLRMPLAGNSREYGFLSVPWKAEENGESAPLPMFVRVLGMQIESRGQGGETSRPGAAGFEPPFALARLDHDGVILSASSLFESLFGQPGRPVAGMRAAALLEPHFGTCPLLSEKPAQDAPESSALEQGRLVTFAKQSSGLPMYMGLAPDPERQGHFCLVLGAVTRANAHQTLALAHAGLMESLLRALPFQVYLLNASGSIVWADAPYRQMLGANIFALSRPAGQHQDGWNASFLSSLTGVARLKASLAGAAGPRVHEIIFAPVRNSQGTAYLLLMGPEPAS